MMAHPLSSPLDAAEMFTARGWVVFPCDHPMAGSHCTGTARACRDRRCKAEADPAQRGKHPRVAWGAITTPADAAQRAAWWGRDVIPTNIAIACGPSGLLVVDEDEAGAFAAFCAHEGHEVPETFTVATARGLHWYFTVPLGPDGQRVPVGNSPGQLAAWHCDVRGGASASGLSGGYVITAGSEHASRKIYTAPDPYAPAIEAPGWLIEAVMTPGPPAAAEGLATGAGSVGDRDATLRASDGARWDDATRYGTAQDLMAQFERHCDEVAHEGGEFRFELFRAARDGWRLVNLGLIDEAAMFRALEACVWRVWRAEPDDRDHVIVFTEALPAAQASPWELTGTELRSRAAVTAPDVAGRTFLRPSEAAALAHADDHPGAPPVTSGDGTDDLSMDGNRSVEVDHGPSRDERTPDEINRDRARVKALERLAADRWARETLDAAGAPEFLCVGPTDRKARPRAEYLVPGMLYRHGLACIFGLPTSGKTYLALDIGLTFAMGQAWRGRRLATKEGARGKVHYVMAEGEDSNNGRIDAWLYHHDLTDDDLVGHFWYFPQRVMLTEAGIKPYLPYVREHQPDLIILDTKNLMFAGKESQGDDYGEMLNALRILQREAGGCAIILIDHAGLKAEDRTRGSNAQKGGMDTEIQVTDDHGLHTAEVTKDRSAPLGRKWHYRLSQIDEVPRGADVAPPAVVVEGSPDSGPLRPRTPWPDMRLSDDLDKAIMDKGGRVKGACRDVVRLLGWLGADEEGQTTAKIAQIVRNEAPDSRKHAESTVRAAVGALVRGALIESTASSKAAPKYVLTDHWRAHVTEPEF